jgi:hypothetical protein
MYSVRTSPRALLVALIPLAAVHAVLFAMALLETQTTPPLSAMPAADKVFLFYCRMLAIEAAMLFAGHLLLRQRAICSRTAYALMGGAIATAAYALAWRNGFQLSQPPEGSEITAGILPAIAGMIAGFLYGQFAGVEPTDSGALSAATGAPRTFDGPVRVRTSVAAVAIASVVPAALSAVMAFSLIWLSLPGDVTKGSTTIFAAALPAQLFITALIATVLPSAIVVLAAHHLARALNRRSGLAYSLAGSAAAMLCAAITAPFTPFTSLAFVVVTAALYGAVMGALYRRFAGLEPVALPEAVLATDPNALVGTDHPARRTHTVIMTR